MGTILLYTSKNGVGIDPTIGDHGKDGIVTDRSAVRPSFKKRQKSMWKYVKAQEKAVKRAQRHA